jgi:nitric oxide reductase NorD protein
LPDPADDRPRCRASPTAARTRRHRQKLRGQFAALAPQRRWLKAQPDGPELDVDACVRNHADRPRAIRRKRRLLAQARCERDLACLLLADLSMSTDAPISDSTASSMSSATRCCSFPKR